MPSTSLLLEGGMRYIFNGATGKFVCGVGGGSVFLSNQEGWDNLSAYVCKFPEGGDVTAIVESYRRLNKGMF